MSNNSNGPLGALKATVAEFFDDDCLTMAAAIAYYTAFSLPPLLVLIVTIAGWIWSADAVTSQVEQQVSDVIGEGGWVQVREMMEAAGEQGSGLAAIVGIVALLFGATGVMAQLQASLNRAWEVQPDPEQGGVKTFAFKRLLSLGMIVAVAFLLLVSLVLTAVLQAMAGVIATWLPTWMASWAPLAIDTAVSLIIFTLLFGAMFKWLPDADVRWRDTWVGAGVTALLFIVGKFALGLYFGMSDTGQYGAAASFVLLLLWAYYSAAIFLFGAEFTQVWARRHGRRIVPEKGAVRVVKQTRQVHEGESEETAGRGAHTGASERPSALSPER